MSNLDEIEAFAAEAGGLLKLIQDELGRENVPKARVRFPRGFIRTARELRTELPLFLSERLRRNISYALMMTDVLRWLAVRTDLSSVALSMVVKEGICLFGAICESLTRVALHGKGGKKSFKIRLEKMVTLGWIDDALKVELEWLWDTRNREHLYGLDDLDHDKYGRDDYNRARRAYARLKSALEEALN